MLHSLFFEPHIGAGEQMSETKIGPAEMEFEGIVRGGSQPNNMRPLFEALKAEIIASAKQETLDNIINTVCGLCAGGTPLHNREGTWAHPYDGAWVVCRAAEIRDMAGEKQNG